MAIIGTAALRPTSGDGTFELGRYTLTQVWRVQTNNLLDDASIVVNAPGLPPVGLPYSAAYPTLRARVYTPKRLGPSSFFWEVTVEYSTPERKPGSGGERGHPGGTGTEKDPEFTDPTQELPTVKFDNSSREVLITQVVDAITGALKPPTSSNGEVYDPPPKMLQRYATLEISRNEPLTANHPALGIQYQNAVSSDVFWGMDPGVWQCKKITADRQVRQLAGGLTVAYLKVVYQFEAAGNWDIQVLDYGTTHLVQSSPPGQPAVRKQFRTAEGHPTAGPLNGQGGALLQNVVCTLTTGTEQVAITGTPFTVANGQVVQFTTVAGTLPDAVAPGAAYYVINSTGTSFQISETSGGAAVAFAASSTPDCYVSQPAVYNTIRPYPRLPFAALNLPQSFTDQIQ